MRYLIDIRRRINTLTIGALAWTLSLQYYLTQTFVAAAWKLPFSWLHNTISDLGNTDCGPYGHMIVCSPSHGWMNASFIILGCTMIFGSLAFYAATKHNVISTSGFVCIGLSGLGSILVGLFPENTVSGAHITGAALSFVLGNLALLFFAAGLTLPRTLRIGAMLAGILALAALVLYLNHDYLGIGNGGMERVIAYPQTIWLTLYGIYCLQVRPSFRPS